MNDFPVSTSALSSPADVGNWRSDGLKIIDELFPVAVKESWDLLLDLRQSLHRGADWEETLDLFLACRQALETSHYLPFYRLRRILAGSLRLASKGNPAGSQSLEEVLRQNHRSLADLKRAVRRDCFEQSEEAAAFPTDFEVVESSVR